jgi:hypothetical protein
MEMDSTVYLINKLPITIPHLPIMVFHPKFISASVYNIKLFLHNEVVAIEFEPTTKV